MSPLHTYIGIKDGKLTVCVSPWELHQISPMHLRGDALPVSVQKFLESGDGNCADILEKMQKYYEPKRRKRGTE